MEQEENDHRMLKRQALYLLIFFLISSFEHVNSDYKLNLARFLQKIIEKNTWLL